MDYCPSGSSANGLFQARILEWVAMPSSRGSSQPRDRTQVSCIGRRVLYHQCPLGSQDYQKRPLYPHAANLTLPIHSPLCNQNELSQIEMIMPILSSEIFDGFVLPAKENSYSQAWHLMPFPIWPFLTQWDSKNITKCSPAWESCQQTFPTLVTQQSDLLSIHNVLNSNNHNFLFSFTVRNLESRDLSLGPVLTLSLYVDLGKSFPSSGPQFCYMYKRRWI